MRVIKQYFKAIVRAIVCVALFAFTSCTIAQSPVDPTPQTATFERGHPIGLSRYLGAGSETMGSSEVPRGESPHRRNVPEIETIPAMSTLTNNSSRIGTENEIAAGKWWKALITIPQRKSSQRSLQISLNSLLVGALNHSAHIQVISDEPLIAETEITTADAVFDWTSFIDARWDDLSEPVGSTLTTGGPPRFQDHNANVEFGLRRRNTIGGEFEIGQRLGHQNTNSIFFIPNDQGSSRLTLSYTQPLLRGAGRVYNTSLTVLAKLNTNVSQGEYERQLQQHLLDVTRAYWTLYFERGKLLQREKLLTRGQFILEELESRANIDALKSQIVRARAAVENRRAQLIQSRLAIRIAEAKIRGLVNDPALGDTQNVELIPKEELSDIPFPVDLPGSVSLAMQQRPEIFAAIQLVKSASVQMNMSKKETLPLLNLIIESYVAGLDGNSNIGQAYRDQFTEGAPSYGVGLQYEYPIWNRAASSRLQKRRLELRRIQHQFRSTMESLKLQVEVSVHELNAAWESLSARMRAMEAAAEEVAYLGDRWELVPDENDSASLLLEDLLDAQDRLTDAETAMLEASLDYALSQVEYKRSVGTLLNQNNIATTRDCGCNLPEQRPRQSYPAASPKTNPFESFAPPQDYQVFLPENHRLPELLPTITGFPTPTSLEPEADRPLGPSPAVSPTNPGLAPSSLGPNDTDDTRPIAGDGKAYQSTNAGLDHLPLPPTQLSASDLRTKTAPKIDDQLNRRPLPLTVVPLTSP